MKKVFLKIFIIYESLPHKKESKKGRYNRIRRKKKNKNEISGEK